MKGKKEEAKKELEEWLSDRLRYDDVPRLREAKEWVKKNKIGLTQKDVKEVMRLHPAYMMNMPQQLMPKGSEMYRPIIVNSLGFWHADIGYFSKNKKYRMPETYRHGFLVAKDVLSRRIYATPLLKSKKETAIIKAFEILFENHRRHLPGVPVMSVSFDKETSVLGNAVQAHLKKQGIEFHAFQMSKSKAKCAEGSIKQIRAVMTRLMKRNRKKDRWYTLLETVVNVLNGQEVVVNGKGMGVSPDEINPSNLEEFVGKLQKAVPAYYWAQFDIAPGLVSFKYPVKTVVRAKLLATSSATIGNKTSEVNLTKDLFVIEKLVPYVTKNLKIGRAYKCRHLKKNYVEVFQEDEITPGREEEEEAWSDLEEDDEETYKRTTRTGTTY